RAVIKVVVTHQKWEFVTDPYLIHRGKTVIVGTDSQRRAKSQSGDFRSNTPAVVTCHVNDRVPPYFHSSGSFQRDEISPFHADKDQTIRKLRAICIHYLGPKF